MSTSLTSPPTKRGRAWTSLIGLGLQVHRTARIDKLSDRSFWSSNSAAIQRRELRKLLSKASNTEIGRKNNFARLAALPDAEILPAYQQTLPVADWYVYKDQIARMREQAEPNVLWPGLVMDYAQTSGTTAGDKFIPVSQEMMKSNYRASLDIFAYMSLFGLSLANVFKGKALFLGGSSDLSVNQHGIRTGDLSGLVVPLIRWPISEVYLPGRQIALMKHWPSKIEAMAAKCLDEDVRMISGMPSWALVLCERMTELARARGQDVRTLRDIWPNFQIFVHGGVKYTPFEPRIRAAWSGSPTGDDVPFRLELYPASEGFVAIQDTRGDPGLRLNTDIGIFFEFVPLEEIGSSNPCGFSCEQVEKGQRYVVVLTTCAGLWRYVLGDVVEFDTIPAQLNGRGGEGPCRLRIVGRHKHFINAFGENLIVEHIENAVAAAANAAGLVVGEFTAAPVYPEASRKSGLELAVEVDPLPVSPPKLESFREAFDQSLKTQNVDYTTKRSEGLGMGPPTITPVPRGTFHRWMLSRGKLGGQHKCPRCANTRDILDQVIGQAGI
ncbi:MAG: GH3 auxin-responsive promoter family protein [Planctomycetota bacterium]|nr:GH3 auxin-responsive promoter family protein [Planctomycetota bacterium]